MCLFCFVVSFNAFANRHHVPQYSHLQERQSQLVRCIVSPREAPSEKKRGGHTRLSMARCAQAHFRRADDLHRIPSGKERTHGVAGRIRRPRVHCAKHAVVAVWAAPQMEAISTKAWCPIETWTSFCPRCLHSSSSTILHTLPIPPEAK